MNTVALTPLIQESLRQTSLQVLVVEPQNGKLSQLLAKSAEGIALEVQEVLDLESLITQLQGKSGYDLVLIDNLAGKLSLDAPQAETLRQCSLSTPILVMGYDLFMAQESGEMGPLGTIRQAAPSHVNSATLVREIRYTLEAHVVSQEFKNQEHRLECLQTMFWQMLEHMPYPVLAVDSEGYVVALNQAAQKLWNGPAEKALFSSMKDSLPEDGQTLEKQINGVVYSADFVRIEWLGVEYFLVTLRH